jgi:hypothetical protein
MIVSTRDLTYDKDERIFVTEASDLGWRAGIAWPPEVMVVSHKTGDTKTFRRGHHKTDREGDLLYVTYWSDIGVSMRVYND